MSKQRKEAILELIDKYEIETQAELASKLMEMGFEVTQATVSRDINKLNLSKVPSPKGKQKYARMQVEENRLSSKYLNVLKEGFVSIDVAQNILVIKTVSGMAMAVAAAVDSMQYPEIVGSIAGDDTIMMAIRNTEDAKTIMNQISFLLSR